MRALTSEDTKAARAYLGWTAKDLAENAELSLDTLRSFESGRNASLSAANQAKVASTLEAQGIQFLDNGEVATGPGVAIRSDDGDLRE